MARKRRLPVSGFVAEPGKPTLKKPVEIYFNCPLMKIDGATWHNPVAYIKLDVGTEVEIESEKTSFVYNVIFEVGDARVYTELPKDAVDAD